MLKMFQAYRQDNDDIEFKFIHVFKRNKTCKKWAEVRASLGKGKTLHLTLPTRCRLPGKGAQ
jgi:hypothetical protein